jgi:hypothetical protein
MNYCKAEMNYGRRKVLKCYVILFILPFWQKPSIRKTIEQFFGREHIKLLFVVGVSTLSLLLDI